MCVSLRAARAKFEVTRQTENLEIYFRSRHTHIYIYREAHAEREKRDVKNRGEEEEEESHEEEKYIVYTRGVFSASGSTFV